MKCYLFDFDGVLVDSMPTWGAVHSQALAEAGISVPANFVETITPLGNVKGAEYALTLGVKVPFDAYLTGINGKLYEAYTTRIVLKDNVKAVLEGLKKAGISVNVLTASPHLYVDPCLQRNGIFDLFDNVWTIEDFGLTKDNPEIYKQAAKRLGAKACDCTMFDDNFTAISTAKAAGLDAVAVYDDTSAHKVADMKAVANRYIYNFEEL